MRSQNPIVRRISAATIGRLRLPGSETVFLAVVRTFIGFLLVLSTVFVVSVFVALVTTLGVGIVLLILFLFLFHAIGKSFTEEWSAAQEKD